MKSLSKKVFVGISGGVDSSVALALLKKQGYDVTGVFLKVWNPDFLECNWREERRSAMQVCIKLGVPFLTMDCEKEYKKEVADYMISEYKVGRTPNPDVFCNKYVKFGVFLKKALEMGADYVATGHYARLFKVPERNMNFFELHESVDKNKDQSYFLYTLNQKQLSHIIFPIGDMTKPEVRKLAKKFGLPTADKKDSQGVCFLGKLDMKDFLLHYIKAKKGNVLNIKGEAIGSHDGAIFYTIGERHGFVINKKSPNNPRCFVVSKDLKNNTITVASKEFEKDEVFSVKEVFIKNLHFISGNEPKFPFKASVRIRYRQEKQSCTICRRRSSAKKAITKFAEDRLLQGGYKIVFDNPQNGVAIGQSAVIYDGEKCLGGGIIEGTI